MFDANTATIHGAAFRAEIDSKLLKALAAEPVTANTNLIINERQPRE